MWQEQLGASSSVKSQDYIWITWHLQHVGLAGTKLWSATACANVALESQKPNTPFCSNPSEFSSRWTLLRYVVCLWQQTHWLSPMAPDLQLMPRNHSWPNNRDSFWLTSEIFTECCSLIVALPCSYHGKCSLGTLPLGVLQHITIQSCAVISPDNKHNFEMSNGQSIMQNITLPKAAEHATMMRFPLR